MSEAPAPEPVEREHFYRRVVGELLERGVLTRDLAVVVVGGGELDRSVLASHGFADVTLTNLDPAQGEVEDAEALSYEDGSFDFGIVSAALHHCRSPLHFLQTEWREGNGGALAMGVRHGLYCLGCCWALMCVLFVVGVMNLIWVAALTAFVLIEKIGPAGAIVARLAGAAMVVIGIVAIV